MPAREQPKEYFMISYDGDEVFVESFFSRVVEEMEHPEIYGMTWEQVQTTLNKHYSDLSKAYNDIADQWLSKTEDDYFLPPNQSQPELW